MAKIAILGFGTVGSGVYEVLCRNAASVSRRAGDVYKRQVYNLSRAALVPAAFCEGRHDLLAIATEDKLHQPYRMPLMPGSKEVFDMARLCGAKAVYVSGAGSTVMAVAEKADHSASRPRGFWKQITSRPRIAATRMPRTSMLVHSWKFPAPKACAVRDVYKRQEPLLRQTHA